MIAAIRHVTNDALNACHVAVVERFPDRRFRIIVHGGAVLKYDAATTLKWLRRNAQTPRWLVVL